jgi:hypothetical protein
MKGNSLAQASRERDRSAGLTSMYLGGGAGGTNGWWRGGGGVKKDNPLLRYIWLTMIPAALDIPLLRCLIYRQYFSFSSKVNMKENTSVSLYLPPPFHA